MDERGFNPKIIGKNMKGMRLEEHLTQEQLSEIADISVQHLSHIECGSSNMSLKTLHTFCKIFFCTPNDILLSTEYPNENHNSLFKEYGLNTKDEEFLEDFIKFLRQRSTEKAGSMQEQSGKEDTDNIQKQSNKKKASSTQKQSSSQKTSNTQEQSSPQKTSNPQEQSSSQKTSNPQEQSSSQKTSNLQKQNSTKKASNTQKQSSKE